jgi:hypothetical protein
LYYKCIVSSASASASGSASASARVITLSVELKILASITNKPRVVNYNRKMFIEQATGANAIKLFTTIIYEFS